jgi:hypothetical protein
MLGDSLTLIPSANLVVKVSARVNVLMIQVHIYIYIYI